ncbi:MAG: phytanoyl-CoA dioxygenase family protein [Acidiferrobacterales bacterium]
MLSAQQIDQYRQQGFVVVRNVIEAVQLKPLSDELDGWIEESRSHSSNYGDTPDGKARFDLEAGHSAELPRLRRVSNPVDISNAYQDVLWDGPIVDAVVDLVGPDVKFHHCKLNIKLPSMETRVDYHQDHAFDPHTNDNSATALLMLDDMTEDNGCLRVVPKSHYERYSHYQDDKFTGAIDPKLVPDLERRSVAITGKAGDLCLLHIRTVHGGPPNHSNKPRRLLICDYRAADAFWLKPPLVLSVYSGRVIRGKPSRVARLVADSIELPPSYKEDSFFSVQGQKSVDEH